MRFEAVLFDLDGTLIDSTADIAWCGNTLLRKHGLPDHPLEAYTRFIGDGVVTLVTRMLPEAHRQPERIKGLVEEYRDLYAGHWNVETYVYPGMADLVRGLKEAGLKLVVLSNKPHDFTVQCVDHYFSAGSFERVLGAGRAFPNKPDPAAALHLASEIGVRPEKFIYMGDTDTDMQTATRAGMWAVGVLWGLRGRDELLLNGAKSLAKEPPDVLRLVSGTAAASPSDTPG